MCMKGCTQESYTRDSFMTDWKELTESTKAEWIFEVNKINFALVQTAGPNHFPEDMVQFLKGNQGTLGRSKKLYRFGRNVIKLLWGFGYFSLQIHLIIQGFQIRVEFTLIRDRICNCLFPGCSYSNLEIAILC